MKNLYMCLFVLFLSASCFGAKCAVNDPDVGLIETTGTTQLHAMERTIIECFNKKKNWYESTNAKINFDILKKFIDDCANPICRKN